MRIGAITSNENNIKPAFKATFLENAFSQELKSVSSKEDVLAFEKACELLKNARKDHSYYSLDGLTSNNGLAGNFEVGDKFIRLGYKISKRDAFNSVRMWVLRGEECVSGGFEKKNVLKEISAQLEKIAKDDIERYLPVKKVQVKKLLG